MARCKCNASGGCWYFLGFVGSLVYYVNATSGFIGVLIAFFKALVWPAFLVYSLLQYLGA